MTIDFTHYSEREQAFVKHTFLDKYLPRLFGKVCSPSSRYSEFVYIDGFAGPWKSAASETFEDTSFGIALNHMTAQRLFYLKKGHNVKMRAFLVEKDHGAFSQLKEAVQKFPKVEVEPLNGLMEDYAGAIASSIPREAFSFTLIDPKGFPDIAKLAPLIKRQNAEALVNFMFDFANRFAGTDLIPALEAWLSAVGSTGWSQKDIGLSGIEREKRLERLAAEALQVMGGYKYAPVISVDKVLHDRALYKLIFLSRRLEGLEVFRDTEFKTLDAQATVRSSTKAKKRAESSTNGDFFADRSDAIANDRSSQIIRRSQENAAIEVTKRLKTASSLGVSWGDLWPPILENFSVTRSWLGRYVNDLRRSNQVTAPGWPSERKQIPDDGQRLLWDDRRP